MEGAFEFTVSRNARAGFDWQVYWKREANLVAVIAVSPTAVGPICRGDIIRSANGDEEMQEIMSHIHLGSGPLHVLVERFSIEDSPCQAVFPPPPRTLYRDQRSGDSLEAARLLLSAGETFGFTDWRLKETSMYLGLYFSIISHPARRLLFVHVTIAHWRRPVRQLEEHHKARILDRAKSCLVDRRFEFCGDPIVDLGHRTLVTFHVHENQHKEMLALSQMAFGFLRNLHSRPLPAWHWNYHLSIDGPAGRA